MVSDRTLSDRQVVTRWVRAIVVIFLMMGLSLGTWFSRLPAVRDELGASTLEMSVYGLSLAAGSVIGLLLAGRLVVRIGPKRLIAVMVIAQIVTLPGAVSLLLIGALPVGLIVLFAYGFSFSTADIAMNVSGANAERAERRSRLPLMHAAYSVGIVLAMFLGAAAEAMSVPLQLHFFAVLAVIGVCTFAMIGLVPADEMALRKQGEAEVLDLSGAVPVLETDPAAPDELATATGSIPVIPHPVRRTESAAPRQRRYSPWRNPVILLIGLTTLSAGLLEGTPSDWLPLALVDGRGVSNEFATIVLGLFFGAVVAARLAGSSLLNRFGRVLVLRASFALAAIGVLTVVVVPGTVGIVLGTIAWGLGTGICWPATISAAADNPDTAVLDVAAVSAVGYTSMLLGPMVFGVLGEYVGLLQAFWVLPAFAVLGFVLAGRIRPHPG